MTFLRCKFTIYATFNIKVIHFLPLSVEDPNPFFFLALFASQSYSLLEP